MFYENGRISVDSATPVNVHWITMINPDSGFKWFHKAVCLAIICTLAAGLFAADVLAMGGCGLKCCCLSKPMAQHPAPQEQIRSAMGCCAGAAQMPCDLVRANELRYPDITIAAATGHGINTVGPANGPAIAQTDRHDYKGQVLDQFERQNFPTPPLYLQNLSFLI